MSLSLSAQITGNVADESTSLPIPGASVSAMALPDSVIVDATVTDAEGRYELTSVQDGFNGMIIASCVGFETASASAAPRVDFALKELSHELREVVVSASSFTASAGKFTFLRSLSADKIARVEIIMNPVPTLKPTAV